MTFVIETPRLELLACNEAICLSILKGDQALGKFIQAKVAPHWNSFGLEIYDYTLKQAREDPEGYTWWSYLVLLKSEPLLIGSCGYKGRPNKQGQVEIGYEIAPDYRNNGFATELTMGLIDHAAQFPEVKEIKAHTLSFVSPSTQVLKKCGFAFIEEIFDPEDGILWQWKKAIRQEA